jgi:hypothetical protein
MNILIHISSGNLVSISHDSLWKNVSRRYQLKRVSTTELWKYTNKSKFLNRHRHEKGWHSLTATRPILWPHGLRRWPALHVCRIASSNSSYSTGACSCRLMLCCAVWGTDLTMSWSLCRNNGQEAFNLSLRSRGSDWTCMRLQQWFRISFDTTIYTVWFDVLTEVNEQPMSIVDGFLQDHTVSEIRTSTQIFWIAINDVFRTVV